LEYVIDGKAENEQKALLALAERIDLET